MKALFFVLFFALICFELSFAQEINRDYYITNQNDTVYGELSSFSSGKIKFKIDKKKTTLNPLATYRVYSSKENKTYAPSYIKDCIVRIDKSEPKRYEISERLRKIERPNFVELVEDGEIVVYYFQIKNYMGAYGNTPTLNPFHISDRFYAFKKATNEIIELKKTGPIFIFNVSFTKIDKNLVDFFDGNSEIIEAINKEPKIKLEFMIEQIKKYNAWKQLIGESAPGSYDMIY